MEYLFQQPMSTPNRQSYTGATFDVAKSGVNFPSPIDASISPKVGRRWGEYANQVGQILPPASPRVGSLPYLWALA